MAVQSELSAFRVDIEPPVKIGLPAGRLFVLSDAGCVRSTRDHRRKGPDRRKSKKATDSHAFTLIERLFKYTARQALIVNRTPSPYKPLRGTYTRNDSSVSGANSSSTLSLRFDSPCSWW